MHLNEGYAFAFVHEISAVESQVLCFSAAMDWRAVVETIVRSGHFQYHSLHATTQKNG